MRTHCAQSALVLPAAHRGAREGQAQPYALMVPAMLALCVLAGGCGANTQPAPLRAESMPARESPPSVRTRLARANYYRRMVGLPLVTYNPAHDDADFKHARYVVKNGVTAVDFSIDNEDF